MPSNHQPEIRNLEGTVIGITGAASGIGLAATHQALAAGAQVIAQDINEAALAELNESVTGDLITVSGDIADPGTAQAMIGSAIANFDRLDSMVMCAGIGLFGGIADHSSEEISRMIRVNFDGTVWSVQSAVHQFRVQGDGGDLVFVASVAGMGIGGGTEAVYAATKGAQLNLAAAIDKELRGEGIRASVIAPAAVNTYFAAATGRFGDTPPEDGPFMQPADIAAAIITVLRQPRRMRTAEWTMWSLAEPRG